MLCEVIVRSCCRWRWGLERVRLEREPGDLFFSQLPAADLCSGCVRAYHQTLGPGLFFCLPSVQSVFTVYEELELWLVQQAGNHWYRHLPWWLTQRSLSLWYIWALLTLFVFASKLKCWQERMNKRPDPRTYLFFRCETMLSSALMFKDLNNNQLLSWCWHTNIKLLPNGIASQCKSPQVCKTRSCVRTCEGWPNRFASRLASSRKSQKS